MSFSFDVPAGDTLHLLTARKYCPEDILVNALAGSGGGDGFPAMPDGYTIESGVYVPDSNKTSAVTIDLQHTFRWNDTGKESACYLIVIGVDIRKGTQAAALGAHVKFGVGERNHQMVTTTSGASTSSTVFMNPVLSNGLFNQFTLTGTGSYPLKANHTYLWLVIGETV